MKGYVKGIVMIKKGNELVLTSWFEVTPG